MARPILEKEKLRCRLDCYLSPTEKKVLRDKARAAGLGMSDFLRKSALAIKITTIPTGNVKRWQELARLSGNLNQLVRAVHRGEMPSDLLPELREISTEVQALRLDLLEASS